MRLLCASPVLPLPTRDSPTTEQYAERHKPQIHNHRGDAGYFVAVEYGSSGVEQTIEPSQNERDT
jgi:hypothetical protein